jgi:hypothetical protein
MTSRHDDRLTRHAGLALPGSIEDLTNDQIDLLLRGAGVDLDALCRSARTAAAGSSPVLPNREAANAVDDSNEQWAHDGGSLQALIEVLEQLRRDIGNLQSDSNGRLRRLEQRLYDLEESVAHSRLLMVWRESTAAKSQPELARGVEAIAAQPHQPALQATALYSLVPSRGTGRAES